MGVQFDRLLEGLSGPFERVTDWNVTIPPSLTVTEGAGARCDRSKNDCVSYVNRTLKSPAQVFSTREAYLVGPAASGTPVHAPRIALWDQYGGSAESGWTRWILEQFEFPFARVYAPELDAGNLNANYDVLILPQGAVPAAGGGGRGGRGGGGRGADQSDADIPAEYKSQLGRITADTTVPQIKAFLDNGGTVIAIGTSAMNLAQQLKLPVENHLVENGAPIPPAKYFVPGSVLTARVDVSHPLAAGMRERTDFFFDNNPVFKLGPGADAAGLKAFAWFDSPTPLHSGWAWGQHYLNGGVLAIDAPVGNGRLVLYGPEILQRAQPHGTFKLLFNALYRSAEGTQR
jgi:hypothetical protein